MKKFFVYCLINTIILLGPIFQAPAFSHNNSNF